MKLIVKAWKSDNEKDGETITLQLGNTRLYSCAEDIDDIIVKLIEAKNYALNAEVRDEPIDFSPDL